MARLDPPSPTPKPSGTRRRLLEVAERLFAEQGIAGASLREITSGADANLASVSYHFGSKEGLLREVLRSRLEPVNKVRIELLDALEAAPQPPSVEAVLDAFIRPALEQFDGPGRNFIRLMAHIHHSPHPAATDFLTEVLGPMAARFLAALAYALPDVPRDRLFVRVHFMIGSMLHCLAAHDPRHCIAGITPGHLSGEQLLFELVHFCAAGFSQPCADSQPPHHPRSAPPGAHDDPETRS